MKKTFNMTVDCANCGAKMEEAIKKIKGVQDATVNFMAQKLVLEAEESDFPRILKEANKVCKKVDDDAEIEY